MTTIESRSPRPKRSFVDFDEPNPSSPQPGTTKRLRIETVEAEQAAKTIQQQPKPLPLKRPHTSFLEDFVDQLPSSPTLKRHRPESVITQWLESVSGLESYQERHCRSDTLLGHLDSKLIPRRLTKSAPNMEYTRDADGFVMPPTPTSTGSHSYGADAVDNSQVSWYAPSVAISNISGASTGSSQKKNLVEDPSYRDMNLTANNIYMRPARDQFPEHITSLVDQVCRDRDSPGPSPEQVWQDTRLAELEMGTAESKVERYFHTNVFPDPEPTDILQSSDRLPMAKYAVPDFGSKLKVSTPVPDLLYGYSRNGAFHQQQTQFPSMGNEMVANSDGLVYLFFVIEFKADGPSGSRSLWVTTNQCLGGSASCVNIAERLNCQLRHCKSDKVQLIDSAAFSIAMNGTEARLYVSWKHDELKYYMRKVKSFLLQEPEQYVEFRKHVRNIIDWGKDKRLKEIRKSLDSLLEENRKMASQLAKSRPPPSDVSASSSSHKRKDSSSRGRNSRTTSVQEYPSGRANALSSTSFQGNNQDESLMQTRAVDSVYAWPYASAQENNQDDSSLYIPAADSIYAPPYASIPANDQDDPFMQISTADHGYTSHSAPYSPITPPQSSKDISLPLESGEDVDDSNVRGQRRSRRTQTQATDPVEGPREVDHNSKSRKTRRKH